MRYVIRYLSVSEQQLVINRYILNEFRFNRHLKFADYLNNVMGFYPFIDGIKKYVLRFKPEYIKDARKRLLDILQNENNSNFGSINAHNNNSMENTQRRMVSIHLRLGDYEEHLKKMKLNLSIVNNSYFTRAMNYIVEKDPVSYS